MKKVMSMLVKLALLGFLASGIFFAGVWFAFGAEPITQENAMEKALEYQKKIKTLEQDIEALRSANKELNEENNQLRDTKTKLAKAQKAGREYRDKCNELQQQLNSSNEEIRNLKSKAAADKASADAAIARMQDDVVEKQKEAQEAAAHETSEVEEMANFVRGKAMESDSFKDGLAKACKGLKEFGVDGDVDFKDYNAINEAIEEDLDRMYSAATTQDERNTADALSIFVLTLIGYCDDDKNGKEFKSFVCREARKNGMIGTDKQLCYTVAVMLFAGQKQVEAKNIKKALLGNGTDLILPLGICGR